MIKKILKRILPLPAKNANESEKRIMDKLFSIQQENSILLDEISFLTNRKKTNLRNGGKNSPKELKEWYFNISGGRTLNLENPQTFTEKLNWLKLNDRNPMKVLLADKFLAPRYADHITQGKIKTAKLLGRWENSHDIDFGALPQKFVLKCNHGSSMNIIVEDKTELDILDTTKKLNEWLRTNYTEFGNCGEWNYSYIKPCVIAEEFMTDGHESLVDYKFHCFNGEPKIIQIIGDRNFETLKHKEIFFDTNWNILDIRKTDSEFLAEKIEKPSKLLKMLEFARKLSKDFIYVRMDFFYINNEVYFGEYTFSPGAGWFDFENPETDVELGKLLTLPVSSEFNGGGTDVE